MSYDELLAGLTEEQKKVALEVIAEWRKILLDLQSK